jgi:hypothetical protein
MTLYARVAAGIVCELIDLPDDVAIPDAFHPDIAAQMVKVPEGSSPEQRWTYADGVFAAPVAAVLTAEQLIAYANTKQWSIATAGHVVEINGKPVPFATTEASMSLMNGKVSRLAQPNPPTTINWQTGPTSFTQIAAADFQTAATSIADWVQSTFDALPAIFTKIANGTIATTDQIDAVLDALAA